MSLVQRNADQDAEIDRLKKIIHGAHFALLTCRASCAGSTTLQHYSADKVRKAVAATEEIAIEMATDNLDSLLCRCSEKSKLINQSVPA